jgi:hypothetical protein
MSFLGKVLTFASGQPGGGVPAKFLCNRRGLSLPYLARKVAIGAAHVKDRRAEGAAALARLVRLRDWQSGAGWMIGGDDETRLKEKLPQGFADPFLQRGGDVM